MKQTKAVSFCGFTLIELLVVIAVIAILASILFPVFSSAKQSGYQTLCTSNLSQFGKAFAMYADDWGGRLPIPGGGTSADAKRCWISDDGSNREVGALMRYIRTQMKKGAKNNFWCCPLAVPLNEASSSTEYGIGQNYIMNDYIRCAHPGEASYDADFPNYLNGMLQSACINSSKTILLFEGVQDSNGICSRHGSPFFINKDSNGATPSPVRPTANAAFAKLKYANLMQNYHNGKSNILFVDGHVKSMSPSDTLSAQTFELYKYTSGKYFQYWRQIYPTATGSTDLWNPHIGGIYFP